jgi:hypothetical protein
MMIRWRGGILFLLALLLPIAAAAEETVREDSILYKSNSLGMKLEELSREDADDHPWVLAVETGGQRYREVLLSKGEIEVWQETVSEEGGKKTFVRAESDGSVIKRVYRDNLLLEYHETEPDGAEVVRSFTYFDGVLLSAEIRRDGRLAETASYIRLSDGSLHMRQITPHAVDSEKQPLSDLLILASDRLSTAVLGTASDFSVVRSYPNGLLISQKWVSGSQAAGGDRVKEADGVMIVTRREAGGAELSIEYNSAGLAERETRTDEDGSVTTLFSYDQNNRLIRSETVTDSGKRTVEYVYDGDRLCCETEFADGMPVSRRTYGESEVREEVYRNGRIYLIVTYEEDGTTIRDTELVRQP